MLMCGLLYIGVPLYSIYKVTVKFGSAQTEEMRNNFGSQYDKLDLEKGRIVLIQPVSFLVRRLLMVYLVVFGPKVFAY